MSLPSHCMYPGCPLPIPPNGRKHCEKHRGCASLKRTRSDLLVVLAEKNAAHTRLGDRIHELETLLNQRNAELAETRHLLEMLVSADRQWRQRERLLEMELERLRGERGLSV